MTKRQLEELIQHERFLQWLARRLLQDEARAQDVVQETWLAVLHSNKTPSEVHRGWLAGVLRMNDLLFLPRSATLSSASPASTARAASWAAASSSRAIESRACCGRDRMAARTAPPSATDGGPTARRAAHEGGERWPSR